jgi:methionine aminopeptidase
MSPIAEIETGFDVMIGNPPFLNQVENATTVDKGLASVARIVTGGSAVRYTDVSATFLLLARNLLTHGGRVAMVQPQSLLAAKAAGPKDGWTVITKDGSLSAQYEHTVAVTKSGVEVLTKL